MNIKPAIYDKLTTRQRILATLEAEARDDKDEIKRLVRTCPKKSYKINDPEYADMMDALFLASMATEADLRGHALAFYMTLGRKGFTLPNGDNLTEHYLREFVSIQTAWNELMEKQGIAPTLMHKAFGFDHPGVIAAQKIAAEAEVEANPEIVTRYKETMDEFLKKWGRHTLHDPIRESVVPSKHGGRH